MSLTMSASFSNPASAAAAMRLLRQAGVSVQPTAKPAHRNHAQAAMPPHAIALRGTVHARAAHSGSGLLLSVEPALAQQAKSIVYRCGGVLR